MFTPEQALLISTGITVVGWLAAYSLNLRQHNKQLQIEAKLHVYREIWNSRNLLHPVASKLQTVIRNPPFELMKSSTILGSATKRREHILEGDFKARKIWLDYLSDLNERTSQMSGAFLYFFRTLEMWMHAMPDLQKAADTLFQEFNSLIKKVHDGHAVLQHLDLSDWMGWDNRAIRTSTGKLADEIIFFQFYYEDMMCLVHNFLISPIFRYKMKIRKPLDPAIKVLAKSGLK